MFDADKCYSNPDQLLRGERGRNIRLDVMSTTLAKTLDVVLGEKGSAMNDAVYRLQQSREDCLNAQRPEQKVMN